MEAEENEIPIYGDDEDDDEFDDQGLRIVSPESPKKQSPINDKKKKKRVLQTEKTTYLQYGVAIENFFNLET